MNLADIPLFAMLRGRLGYLSGQQKVIAQNVANADTPRYVSQDLKPFGFDARMQVAQAQGPSTMAATHAAHIRPKSAVGSQYKAVRAPSSEITLNGNTVVLQEEMIRMSEARMNYDAAIGFYQKSLNILRLAAKPPTK